MKKIVVLVSGGGTNLQALMDAQARGEIPHGRIVGVISSRAGAFALERARKSGVPARALSPKSYPDAEAYGAALLEQLASFGADVVVLAGFLCILSRRITRAYEGKILNIHPSLIPSFCGPGYYGLHVHEAALQRGVRVTGATVHFVNEVPDGGAIVLQKAVEVRPDDTPETLQRRVMEQAEWKLLPRAVEMLCAGEVRLENGRAVFAPARPAR